MKDYLERFSKRMELVAVIDSITGRVNKNLEIERLFQEGELENILLSVLVFIMETTLTEEQSCTIEAITGFLSEILPAYGKQMGAEELDVLSRYLIKDLLQNKGEVRTYPVMDYSGGKKNFPVRLIADKLDNDHQVLYELTKQGFDFLFRTKEVDDELGFEIEAIRLRMLISKKNYKKATSQSKYIIAMLIEKRNELRQFEQQMRYDIFSVSGEQYDSIVRNVDSMLQEEYEVMREIERMLELAQQRLDEENRLNFSPDDKSLTARREIAAISENVQRALGMQRELLIRCNDLRKLYLSLLQDSLAFSQFRRFDIEDEILGRMERAAFSSADDISVFRAGLLSPLFFPDVRRSLNIGLLYDRQAKLKEPGQDGVFEEDEIEDDGGRLERIRSRNDAHTLVIRRLLEFAGAHSPTFLFSDFWAHITTQQRLSEMTAGRLLFLDMLKLYEIRAIDLVKWRGTGVHAQECMGEFDLDYCLARCAESDRALFSVVYISVEKTGERVFCDIGGGERVSIDNLMFGVSLSEGYGEGTV